MRKLSNTTRPFSYGETQWEDGYPSTSLEGKTSNQELINAANSIPLVHIFGYYNLNLTDYNNTIVCPFKDHKGGREGTPSFNYYSQTNSFYCFGCSVGGHCCDFVSNIENIRKSKAAIKILDLFKDFSSNKSFDFDIQDLSERLEIMMVFSNVVREFRGKFSDEKSEKFIEHCCMVYDDLNLSHKLSNQSLIKFIEPLKKLILSYKKE